MNAKNVFNPRPVINFKICDNAPECSGAAVCPNKVIVWNDGKKTLEVSGGKCSGCGSCEKACMVQAIRVARTEEEFERITEEYSNDPRQINDLFVDRYGAVPIDPAFTTEEEDFEKEIASYPRLVIAELYSDESIECLLKSIPVKELFPGVNTRFRKVHLRTEKLKQELEVDQLPAMVIMDNGRLLGKVCGYYAQEKKTALKEKIDNILKA